MSGCFIDYNLNRTVEILSIKDESPTVKVLTFKDDKCLKAKPGQFLMIWIPSIDEIPLSILDVTKDGVVSVAIKRLGKATEALHNKRIGEKIGLRGPFGNNFTLKEGKILLVGGGTGNAPLLFLAKKLISRTKKLVFVTGSKTKSELLFISELKKICNKDNLIATTEDGSFGLKCLATKPCEKILDNERFNMIYTCGPEKMMRVMFDLAEKNLIPIEVSLERLMRCSIGLCGSCIIGKYRVCKDGPVFKTSQLKEVKGEFGFSKLDFTGKSCPLS